MIFLKNIDPSIVEGEVRACQFDLCALEGDKTQETFRCNAMESFNKKCLDLANKLNLKWKFNWRNVTNCRKLLF